MIVSCGGVTSCTFLSVLMLVPSANVKIKIKRKLFPCIVNVSLDLNENEESNPKRASAPTLPIDSVFLDPLRI